MSHRGLYLKGDDYSWKNSTDKSSYSESLATLAHLPRATGLALQLSIRSNFAVSACALTSTLFFLPSQSKGLGIHRAIFRAFCSQKTWDRCQSVVPIWCQILFVFCWECNILSPFKNSNFHVKLLCYVTIV